MDPFPGFEQINTKQRFIPTLLINNVKHCTSAFQESEARLASVEVRVSKVTQVTLVTMEAKDPRD